MYINLELYRFFCEVAKTGNITRAAENLFISQSAVSQAIMQLEEKLACKLFNRSKHGVKLTAEGEILFSYVGNGVSIIDKGQEKIESMKNLDEGEVKIGASDTACTIFLLPFLSIFTAAHPEIRISVINRTSRELIDLLKKGTVDISFVNLPVEPEPAIEIQAVMKFHDCFVAGAKYAHLADSIMPLRDLQKYPVLMLEKNSNSRKQMDLFLQERQLEIIPAIELESLALVAEFAKIGLGIAATIKEGVQDMLTTQDLYELRFIEKMPARKLGVAHMKDISLSFAAEAFRKAVLESYEGQGAKKPLEV